MGAAFDFIENNKMILIPMQDTGQFYIVDQLFNINPYPNAVEADTFGGIADAEHGNAFAGDKGFFPQGLKGIAATVMLGNHAEASGTAIHRVQLGVVGEKRVIACLCHCYPK
jgi:hypothetical protein